MTKFKLWGPAIVMLLPFMASGAYAGGSVENGGNVVVCRTPGHEIQSIELLDYYEARVMRGLNLDYAGEGADVSDGFRKLMVRLGRLSPDRVRKYTDEFLRFDDEALLVPGVELVTIPDSKHLFLPKGCEVTQIVIQRIPEFQGDKRYFVNADLWSLLSVRDKVGLILHELLLREAMEQGVETSVATRYLNSLLASPTFDRLSFSDFAKILSEHAFSPQIEYCGVLLDLRPGSISFYDNGLPQFARLIRNGTYRAGGPTSFEVPLQVLAGKRPALVEFHRDGSLKSGSIVEGGQIMVGGKAVQFVGMASFYEGAGLEAGVLFVPLAQSLPAGSFTVSSGWPVQFYPSGALREGVLDGKVILRTVSGRLREIHTYNPIRFSEFGLVIDN